VNTPSPARGAFTVWRILIRAQLRDQPGRLAVTVIAIALGVALGAAVYLVNTAALNEFGLATKRLVGEADVVVRGSRDGFDERVFTQLAQDPAVDVASPVLELSVALPGRRDTLKVLGLDPFRAASLQPAIIGDIGAGIFDLFHADGIFLSSSAAQALNLKRGDSFPVIVGSQPRALHVRSGSWTSPRRSGPSRRSGGSTGSTCASRRELPSRPTGPHSRARCRRACSRWRRRWNATGR
jgi:putative ABC transport system permease protein